MEGRLDAVVGELGGARREVFLSLCECKYEREEEREGEMNIVERI